MLRALIVLPTRDLVNQVRETFESIAKGQGLKVCYTSIGIEAQKRTLTRAKIASTTGQHSFVHEQNSIVETSSPLYGTDSFNYEHGPLTDLIG